MTIIANILILFAGVTTAGLLAFGAAVVMADTGMLGTCFEGACGYAAVFVAFPLLWLLFTALYLVAWYVTARRKRRNNDT